MNKLIAALAMVAALMPSLLAQPFAEAGSSNTVWLARSDGSRVSYVTPTDNPVARGNTLLAALAAQNTNDLILIGPGEFELRSNPVITSNGVRVAGSGQFSTILRNTMILYNQSNSFSALTVSNPSAGAVAEHFHPGASTYAGPYLDHVYAVGDVDCLVMSRGSLDFSADNCVFLGVQGDSVTARGSGRFNNCVFGGATSAYRETSTDCNFTFKGCSFTNYAMTPGGLVVMLRGQGDVFENCDFNGVSTEPNSIGVQVQSGAAPWLLNCRIMTSSSADTPKDIVVDPDGFCYVNAATVYQEAKTTGIITPLPGNAAGLFGTIGDTVGTTHLHDQNGSHSSGELIERISGVSPGGANRRRSNGMAPTSFAFPASTVNWTNPINCSIQVYVDNFGVTGSVLKKNGEQISRGLTGFMQIGLQAGEYFSETYTTGTPTATYSPFQ